MAGNVPSSHPLALEYDHAEHCHQEKQPSAYEDPQDGIAYPNRGKPEAGAYPYHNPRQGDSIGNDSMGEVNTRYDQ